MNAPYNEWGDLLPGAVVGELVLVNWDPTCNQWRVRGIDLAGAELIGYCDRLNLDHVQFREDLDPQIDRGTCLLVGLMAPGEGFSAGRVFRPGDEPEHSLWRYRSVWVKICALTPDPAYVMDCQSLPWHEFPVRYARHIKLDRDRPIAAWEASSSVGPAMPYQIEPERLCVWWDRGPNAPVRAAFHKHQCRPLPAK